MGEEGNRGGRGGKQGGSGRQGRSGRKQGRERRETGAGAEGNRAGAEGNRGGRVGKQVGSILSGSLRLSIMYSQALFWFRFAAICNSNRPHITRRRASAEPWQQHRSLAVHLRPQVASRKQLLPAAMDHLRRPCKTSVLKRPSKGSSSSTLGGPLRSLELKAPSSAANSGARSRGSGTARKI